MSDLKILIDKFINHIDSGRFAEAFEMLNEDGKYIVIGSTPASGVYEGRADLFARLLPLLGSFPTPPALTFGDVIVDGNKGAIRASGQGVGPKGDYNQPYYIWYVRAEGDGFAEMIEFMDTAQLESAIYGRRFSDA